MLTKTPNKIPKMPDKFLHLAYITLFNLIIHISWDDFSHIHNKQSTTYKCSKHENIYTSLPNWPRAIIPILDYHVLNISLMILVIFILEGAYLCREALGQTDKAYATLSLLIQILHTCVGTLIKLQGS